MILASKTGSSVFIEVKYSFIEGNIDSMEGESKM